MADGEGSWQRRCTAELMRAVDAGRGGVDAWEAFRAGIAESSGRIIVADANFDRRSLSGFDLSRCYFTRVCMRECNLSRANFSQTIFRRCDATGANVEGARFRGADLKGDGLRLADARFDGETDFEVDAALLPDEIAPGLRAAAARARGARLWRYRRSYSPSVQVMLWLTRDGYALGPLAVAGVFVMVLFAVIFWALGSTPGAALFASAEYFFGLNAAFSADFSAAAGLLEGLLGILFLAVLTALLVSMIYDRH